MTLAQCWDLPPAQPELARDEVHVWSAPLEQPAARVDELWRTLAADERARAERFVFMRDRSHFIVARGILRAVLGRYLGLAAERLAFVYGPHGKPALAETCGGDMLRFNLAHSQGLALYAVTRGREVGVDIEQVRPLPDAVAIARHFFAAQEQEALRALPPGTKQAGFYHCWTRKEAYLKALGDGLARPLDQFSVSLAPGEPARLLTVAGDAREAERWSLRALEPAPGYVGALAAPGHDWQVACWRWPE
jgi:4'-phosphopantetheinyl transferase